MIYSWSILPSSDGVATVVGVDGLAVHNGIGQFLFEHGIAGVGRQVQLEETGVTLRQTLRTVVTRTDFVDFHEFSLA